MSSLSASNQITSMFSSVERYLRQFTLSAEEINLVMTAIEGMAAVMHIGVYTHFPSGRAIELLRGSLGVNRARFRESFRATEVIDDIVLLRSLFLTFAARANAPSSTILSSDSTAVPEGISRSSGQQSDLEIIIC